MASPPFQGVDAPREQARDRWLQALLGADLFFPEEAIDVVPSREAALDRGLELTPVGGELTALPTYTAMLALRDLVVRRGFVRPYWEEEAA